MALLTPKNTAPNRPEKGTRAYYESQLVRGKSQALVFAICTLINVVLTLTSADLFFLFSGWYPYIQAVLAQIGPSFLGDGSLPLALICVALLLVCFIFWTKHAALPALFNLMLVADTLYLVYWMVTFGSLVEGMMSSMVLSTLFHIWVAVYTIPSAIAAFKLKDMPETADFVPSDPGSYTGPEF